MKLNLLRCLLGVFIVSVVLSIVVLQSHGLMDQACRGTDDCSDIWDACADTSEIGSIIRLGSLCDGPGICISYFRVACWDWEEEDDYYRYAQCETGATWDECGSAL